MMKPRKVMVHLELLSGTKIDHLKSKVPWQGAVDAVFEDENIVHQVTVQVIKEKK